MSVATNVNLSNADGYSVAIGEDVATKYFRALSAADAIVDAAAINIPDLPSSKPDPSTNDEPLSVEHMQCSKEVLDSIKFYAEMTKKTTKIPRPLTKHVSNIVTAEEMELVKAAEAGDYIRELLNQSIRLRFDELTALCAAYLFCRIDEIAKAAPDIMAGAESIRQFLHMKNEWTEEEMGHLRKEMEYAKKMNPNAY